MAEGSQVAGAFVEGSVYGVPFDLPEELGGAVGAYVGTGSFGGVGEAHAAVAIALLDGLSEKLDLLRSVVDRGREELAHQIAVVHRDIAELITIEHGRRIENLHTSI